MERNGHYVPSHACYEGNRPPSVRKRKILLAFQNHQCVVFGGMPAKTTECFNIMFLALIHLRCQPFVTVDQQRFVISFNGGTGVLRLCISRIQVSILLTNQLVQVDCCEPLRCNQSQRNFSTACAMPFVLNTTPTVPNRRILLRSYRVLPSMLTTEKPATVCMVAGFSVVLCR